MKRILILVACLTLVSACSQLNTPRANPQNVEYIAQQCARINIEEWLQTGRNSPPDACKVVCASFDHRADRRQCLKMGKERLANFKYNIKAMGAL